MAGQALISLLRSAAQGIRGEAIAIGAAVGELSEFLCRGSVAGALVDAHTVFYGASVTKQIVGVATVRAVIDRVVGVGDPVVRWVPQLPDSMGQIQLRHLIHQTSAVPDVTNPADGVPMSNAEVIDRLRQIGDLNLEPGARYAYNNAGYVLLAEAVARSRGQEISEVADDLFKRLRLLNTRVGGLSLAWTALRIHRERWATVDYGLLSATWF